MGNIQNDLTEATNASAQIIDESAAFEGQRQLTEEEAAPLRQMIANGQVNNGLSPEYMEKIPPKYHNQITLDCANKKVAQIKAEAQNDITLIAGTPAVSEIIKGTVDDTVVYGEYDTSSIDNYIEKLDSLSLLECVSLKKSITGELSKLESCKTMLDAVDEMRQNFDFNAPGKQVTAMDAKNAGKDINKDIMAANYLDEYGYDKDADEFKQFYATYQPKFTNLIEKIDVKIKSLKELADSTEYLTNDMVTVVDKKLRLLDQNGTNYEYKKVRLERVRDAFANRTNLDYLFNKFKNFAMNKGSVRTMVRAINNGSFSNITDNLRKDFTEDNLNSVIYLMSTVLGFTDKEIICFIYFLNKVCGSEAKTNFNVWVKVFVLNLTDIASGFYDLKVMDRMDYLNEFKLSFATNLCDIAMTKTLALTSSMMQGYDHIKNLNMTKTNVPDEYETTTGDVVECAEPVKEMDMTVSSNSTVEYSNNTEY